MHAARLDLRVDFRTHHFRIRQMENVRSDLLGDFRRIVGVPDGHQPRVHSLPDHLDRFAMDECLNERGKALEEIGEGIHRESRAPISRASS